MTSSLEAGSERFSGFADLYDEVRPTPPADLGLLMASYLGREPEVVVDFGSGTGLSSRWASTWAAEVNDDELRAPITDNDPEATRYSGIDAHENRTLHEAVKSWSKTAHLARMTESGRFAWCREVALTSTDTGSAERLIGLLKSQGDYQTLRRHGLDDEALGVDHFADVAESRLGSEPRPWRFVYRARLGFKGPGQRL